LRVGVSVLGRFTVFLGPGFDLVRLWNYNGNGATPQGVTIHKRLSDHGRQGEHVLDFFWRNVLSLRKLENVLGSVNNLYGPVGVKHSYVSCLEPTIFVEGLVCLVLTLVVSTENSGSLHAELTSRVRFI